MKKFFLALIITIVNGEAAQPTINQEKVAEWCERVDLNKEQLESLADFLKLYNQCADACGNTASRSSLHECKKKKQELKNKIKHSARNHLLIWNLNSFIDLYMTEIRHEALGEQKLTNLQQAEAERFYFELMSKLSQHCLECIQNKINEQEKKSASNS